MAVLFGLLFKNEVVAYKPAPPAATPQPRATMASYRFNTLDVFTAKALYGNALAVVHDAKGLSDAAMQKFANWTALSETTFLLPPTDPQADYRVRIFTPSRELPFAGHPTLGTCHAWLAAGGKPRSARRDRAAMRRRSGARASRRQPSRVRSSAVEAQRRHRPATLAESRAACASRPAIRAAQWVGNGPEWVAVMLGSRAELLALKPDFAKLDTAGHRGRRALPAGRDTQFEMRAFIGGSGPTEDP